jgi:hypothetical protein
LESIQEDQLQDAVVNEEIKEDFPSTCLQGPTPSKKKKKNGFNLRKSLAWNNAFFTEEGMALNPFYLMPPTLSPFMNFATFVYLQVSWILKNSPL